MTVPLTPAEFTALTITRPTELTREGWELACSLVKVEAERCGLTVELVYENPERAEARLFAEQRLTRATKHVDVLLDQPVALGDDESTAQREGLERAWAREWAARQSLEAIRSQEPVRYVGTKRAEERAA